MAEYLAELGYTERESQKLLGHNSLMIHRAYAAQSAMSIPAPDVMAAKNKPANVIDMHKAA